MGDTIALDARALRMDFIASTAGDTAESNQERARRNAYAVAKLLEAGTAVREAAIAVRQNPEEPEFARQWAAMLAGQGAPQTAPDS